ncbi:MAG: hypothetical protein ACI4EI_12720 [Muricoprocola sp.]
MNKRDNLRMRIEKERMVLNQLLEEKSILAVLEQSRKVDDLIEEYLSVGTN